MDDARVYYLCENFLILLRKQNSMIIGTSEQTTLINFEIKHECFEADIIKLYFLSRGGVKLYGIKIFPFGSKAHKLHNCYYTTP